MLLSLATGCPAYEFDQHLIQTFAVSLLGGGSKRHAVWLSSIFENTGIQRRSFSAPLDWFSRDRTFAEKNKKYVDAATALAEDVTRRCLERAEIQPEAIDHFVFATTTGISTPSLEARVAGNLGFSEGLRRTPIWGLGCAGGAGGLARAFSLAKAEPGSNVLFVSLELCSLTFQHHDYSKSNLVASSLFADGAAAALMREDETHVDKSRKPPRGLELLASGSTLWPESLDVMGWEVNQGGLKVVFSRDIPEIVGKWLKPRLENFLNQHNLTLSEIDHFGLHPGGPKVMNAFRHALCLNDDQLAPAITVFKNHGNMSSPTCLFVLEEILSRGVGAGEKILVLALGPGFTAEYVLLEVGSNGGRRG